MLFQTRNPTPTPALTPAPTPTPRYRFPTGESGADVYTRVCQWWDQAVMRSNLRHAQRPWDSVVVVTHGLTMRLILMQVRARVRCAIEVCD